MQNQIYPLKLQLPKRQKPTFKEWFKERKRILILVLVVTVVVAASLILPFVDLGQFFKGQIQLDQFIPVTLPQEVSDSDTIHELSYKIGSDNSFTVRWKEGMGEYGVLCMYDHDTTLEVYNDEDNNKIYEDKVQYTIPIAIPDPKTGESTTYSCDPYDPVLNSITVPSSNLVGVNKVHFEIVLTSHSLSDDIQIPMTLYTSDQIQLTTQTLPPDSEYKINDNMVFQLHTGTVGEKCIFDFGDGSPVDEENCDKGLASKTSELHQYTKAGTYTATGSTKDADGTQIGTPVTMTYTVAAETVPLTLTSIFTESTGKIGDKLTLSLTSDVTAMTDQIQLTNAGTPVPARDIPEQISTALFNKLIGPDPTSFEIDTTGLDATSYTLSISAHGVKWNGITHAFVTIDPPSQGTTTVNFTLAAADAGTDGRNGTDPGRIGSDPGTAGTTVADPDLIFTATPADQIVDAGSPVTLALTSNTDAKVASLQLTKTGNASTQLPAEGYQSDLLGREPTTIQIPTTDLHAGTYSLVISAQKVKEQYMAIVGRNVYVPIAGTDKSATVSFTLNAAEVTPSEGEGEGESAGALLASTTPPALTLTSSQASPIQSGVENTFTLVIGAATGYTTGTCSINFGDGTASPASKTCTPGGTNVTWSHTYNETIDKPNTIVTATYTDADKDPVSKTQTYSVLKKTDEPTLTITTTPTTPAALSTSGKVSVTFTLTPSNTVGTNTYRITFGDETSDSQFNEKTGAGAVTFTHDYTTVKSYPVSAKLMTTYLGSSVTKTAALTYAVAVPPPPTCTSTQTLVNGVCQTIPTCTSTQTLGTDNVCHDKTSANTVKISKVATTKTVFNPGVNAAKITYQLSEDADVTVEILDAAGKLVVTLLDDERQTAKNAKGTAITQSVWFNGTTDNSDSGQKLKDATYTYRITARNTEDSTDSTTKEGAITIDSKDTAVGDWESGGNTTSGAGLAAANALNGITNVITSLQTSTGTNQNKAAVAMQNNPPINTSGTGPETAIYLIFPAITALGYSFRKRK